MTEPSEANLTARSRRRMSWFVGALTIALSCVLGEALVRIVEPQTNTTSGHAMFLADELLGHRLAPGHTHGEVTINSHGLRDLERARIKPPGVRRVVVLGDSFTYGASLPMNDAYPRVLESELGEGVQVINAGVSGYGTWQERRWLERDGLAWQPDVIVVGFFIGNDIWENISERLEVVDGELAGTKARKERSWFRRLRNRSHLYRLLKALPTRIEDAVTGESSLERAYHKLERHRLGVCAMGDAAAWEKGWEVAAGELRAIKALAGARPVVLLVIPDEFQVDAGLRTAVARRYDLDMSDYDPESPQRRLAALTRELGLVLLDPLPELRERTEKGEQLYIRYDSHWNATAHALIARRLAQLPALAELSDR